MVDRKGGNRRKTRNLFKRKGSEKGKISIRRFLTEYKAGDRVALVANPSYQKGLYFRRFHGNIGVVKAKKGSCYEIDISNNGLKKTVIVHPVHLKKVEVKK